MTLDSTITHTPGTSIDMQPLAKVEVREDVAAWIISQKARGNSNDTLLNKLCAAGWKEHIARRTLGMPELPVSSTVDPSPRPGPDLHAMSSRIDVGDREVEVLMHMEHPRVVLFGGVLSRYECEALIASARERELQRSKVVSQKEDGTHVDQARTSEGMYFRRGETELVARIETRISRLLRWPVDHGEGIQVLHYQSGGEYKPHYDYFRPDGASTANILKRGGQRVGTLIMYLASTRAGGATIFPESKLSVMPQRGSAVFFGYDRPDPTTLTLHGGAPVVSGEKWIATKWLRERKYV